MIRSRVPIERFGIYDPEPDLDGGPEIPDIDVMLATCSPLGRRVLIMFAVDKMTYYQISRKLRCPIGYVRQAHDFACLAMASECRRLGWTEDTYRAAIGG